LGQVSPLPQAHREQADEGGESATGEDSQSQLPCQGKEYKLLNFLVVLLEEPPESNNLLTGKGINSCPSPQDRHLFQEESGV
jgi:hypothetical protein